MIYVYLVKLGDFEDVMRFIGYYEDFSRTIVLHPITLRLMFCKSKKYRTFAHLLAGRVSSRLKSFLCKTLLLFCAAKKPRRTQDTNF